MHWQGVDGVDFYIVCKENVAPVGQRQLETDTMGFRGNRVLRSEAGQIRTLI